MNDPFSYSSRWDSVGLDCSNCKYFGEPDKWPDMDKQTKCLFHNISLQRQIGTNGYKEGEWFCKDFNNVNAQPKALAEFKFIKENLCANILYGVYGKGKQLIEIEFGNLSN